MKNPTLGPKNIVYLVLLVTTGAYIPALFGDFFIDDFVYIVGNDELMSIPWTEIWKIFFTPTNNFEYLPIRDLSYWIDYSLFGMNHTAFIWHNIILYILCCAVIWPCCKQLLYVLDPKLKKGGIELASLNWMLASIVVLFAFHPAHVESVAWASGRKELLSGLFFLCCLWQFCAAISGDTVLKSKLILAALFFLLALGSKAVVLPLAGILFLLALIRFYCHTEWKFDDNLKQVAIYLLIILVISFAYLLIFIDVSSQTGISSHAETNTLGYDAGPIDLAMKIQGYLLGLSVFPFQPRLIYDVTSTGISKYISTISGILVFVVAALGLFALIRKKWIVPAFFAIYFVLVCLPYLQFIPFNTWSLASERFVFLAVIAPVVVIAYFSFRLGPAARKFVIGALGALYLLVTFSYTLDWRDSSSLWRVAVARTPVSATAQEGLILGVLIPEGKFSEALESATQLKSPIVREILITAVNASSNLKEGNILKAREISQRLETLLDNYSDPFYFFLIGEIAEKKRDFISALKNYFRAGHNSPRPNALKKSLSLMRRVRSHYAQELIKARGIAEANSTSIPALGNLANLEMELYLHTEATENYNRILGVIPDQPVAHYNLGLIAMREERYSEASERIEKSVNLGLTMPKVLNNLGKARRNAGELEQAKIAFQRAINLDPKSCVYRINLLRTLNQRHEYSEARNTLNSIVMAGCEQKYQFTIEYLRSNIDDI